VSLDPEFWTEEYRALRRRRRLAERRYAFRLQVGDVIHAPSGPLRVVVAPVVNDRGLAVMRVLDYYRNDPTPHERELVLRPKLEVLASRV
jgi:hypothetical protein